MNSLPIPAPDPMPLPAPVWLLTTLLMVTFFLHLLFMNGTVGAAVIAVVDAIRTRRQSHPAHLAQKLTSLLPVLMAFTITLGVAALLFVQVLYGQMLYVSSILVGAAWLMVVPLLIVGYYGFYWASLKSSFRGLVVGATVLLLVAFVYVNNMTLMLTPQRWLEMYLRRPSGVRLFSGDLMVYPRYLHMMLGAVAMGSLLTVILAIREKDDDIREWMLRQGTRWFTYATLVNMVAGAWFFVALRPEVRRLFMGAGKLATALLILGVLLPIGAMMHLRRAAKEDSRGQAFAGIGTALLILAIMIGMRDIVRASYLGNMFRPGNLAVSPQWSVIGLFLLIFGVGLATVYWMLHKIAFAKKDAVKIMSAGK